jgi:hypothetical protein
MPRRPPLGRGQSVDFDEFAKLDALDHQLRYPVAAT